MAFDSAFSNRTESEFRTEFDTLWQTLEGQPSSSSEDEISNLDPNTPEGQRRIYNLALSGAGGAISGVGPQGSTQESQQEQRRQDAKDLYYALMLDAQRQQIEQEIDRINAEIARLDDELDELRREQERIEDVLHNLDIDKRTNEGLLATIERQLAETDTRLNASYASIRRQHSGLPEIVDINNAAQMSEIRAALSSRRGGLAQFDALETVWREQETLRARETALNLERDRIEQQIRATRDELSRNIESQRLNREQVAEYREQLSDLRGRLEDINEEFRTFEAQVRVRSPQLANTVQSISEFPSRFERYKNGQITRDELVAGLPPEIADQLINAHERVRQAAAHAQDEAAMYREIGLLARQLPDRHTMIRERYLPTFNASNYTRAEDALFGSREIAFAWDATKTFFGDQNWENLMASRPSEALNRERALEHARNNPNSLLVQGWRHNVIMHGGHQVYRSNEDGRFYTIRSGRQVFIEDPAQYLRIMREYTNEGRFVANETPFGDETFDSFRETGENALRLSGMQEDQGLRAQEAERILERVRRDAQTLTQRLSGGGTTSESSGTAPARSSFAPAALPVRADTSAGSAFAGHFGDAIDGRVIPDSRRVASVSESPNSVWESAFRTAAASSPAVTDADPSPAGPAPHRNA